MNRMESNGPDFSGSVPLVDGTQLHIPGKPGMQIVLKTIYIEKGGATSVDLNWKDPSSTIINTANAAVINWFDACVKSPVGAGLETVTVGSTGRLVYSGWYVSNARM